MSNASTPASSRWWKRDNWALCCGSCRRTSSATTRGSTGALRALPPGRHCIEFREPSWFTADVYALLREHNVALVIGDRPEIADFQTHEMTADWTYVRFHYGRRGRRGNYSETELETWRKRVTAWRRDREVFLYFNNDWEGFSIQNALWMAKRF